MINKKISNSKRVNNLPGDGALLYTWLLAHVDVNGVFYADARLVLALVLPRREGATEAKVKKWLSLMAEAKKDDETPLIHLFSSDGDTYLWCPGFEDEQIGLYWKREKPEHPLPLRELYEKYGFSLIKISHKDGETKDHIRKYTGRQSSETSDNDPKLAAMIECYEQNIGALAPLLVDELKIIRDDREIPGGWFEDAVKEAKTQNKGSLKYIEGILKRWVREGRTAKGEGHGADREHTPADSPQQRTERLKASVRTK